MESLKRGLKFSVFLIRLIFLKLCFIFFKFFFFLKQALFKTGLSNSDMMIFEGVFVNGVPQVCTGLLQDLDIKKKTPKKLGIEGTKVDGKIRKC